MCVCVCVGGWCWCVCAHACRCNSLFAFCKFVFVRPKSNNSGKHSRWKGAISLKKMNPPIYLHFHPAVYPSSLILSFFHTHCFQPLSPPPSLSFFPPLSQCVLPVCRCSLVFIPSACSVSESIHFKIRGVSEERAQRGSMGQEKCQKQDA